MGVDVRGSHFWELSSCANSLAGNLPGKGKKVPLEYCRSRHDKDVDSSVVEEPIELDNAVSDDAAFLLKLVGVSFAGGALIKYGSLLSSVPFTPSPSMALSIVILPPLAFSIWMLAQDASGTANDES